MRKTEEINIIEYLAGKCILLDKENKALRKQFDSDKKELVELRSIRYEAEKLHAKVHVLQEEVKLLKHEKEELRKKHLSWITTIDSPNDLDEGMVVCSNFGDLYVRFTSKDDDSPEVLWASFLAFPVYWQTSEDLMKKDGIKYIVIGDTNGR